jgi:transposase
MTTPWLCISNSLHLSIESNIVLICSSVTTIASTRRPANGLRWPGHWLRSAGVQRRPARPAAGFDAGRPYVTDAELSARLTAAKATTERVWLGDVSAVVLQQALADLNAAYRSFFASITGNRKGPKVMPPRFRSRKDHRQAIRFTRNARFAKSVHDAGWSAFVNMLEYKARLYGRTFRRVDRFEPTSQVCSACGARDGPKPLHIRTWQCRECGAWLDRDVNAAVNVARAAGLAVSACGAQVRPERSRPSAVKQEPSQAPHDAARQESPACGQQRKSSVIHGEACGGPLD